MRSFYFKKKEKDLISSLAGLFLNLSRLQSLLLISLFIPLHAWPQDFLEESEKIEEVELLPFETDQQPPSKATDLDQTVLPRSEPSQDKVLIESSPNIKPLVKLEPRFNANYTYKDRRRTHGLTFAVEVTQILMDEYTWFEGENEYLYETVFGTGKINSPDVYLGYKFNFILGALGAEAGYGTFRVSSDQLSGTKRTLGYKKYSGRFTYYLDNMFSEPYVVPFTSVSVWKMRVEESIDTEPRIQEAYDTGVGLSFSAGLLLQLNFLESSSARGSRRQFGIENTYLSAYIYKQEGTDKDEDPDLSTGYTYGMGLKLEF